MKIESASRDSIELLKSTLRHTPEALNTVDVATATSKFIRPMLNAEVLRVADINQPVVAAPAVAVNHSFRRNAAPNNGLKCDLLAVGHDLGVDRTVAPEDAEDNGLTARSTATFAAHAASAKVGLINFDLAGEGRLTLTFFGDAATDFEKDRVNALARQAD